MSSTELAFVQRTRRHIELVARNLLLMEGYLALTRAELTLRARNHDASKFSEEEKEGYAALTWSYQHAGPLGARDQAEALRALALHRSRNRHHPEAHGDPEAMTDLDLVEMVCDWHAISLENGQGIEATRSWMDKNLSKWNFSPRKVRFLIEALAELRRREPMTRVHEPSPRKASIVRTPSQFKFNAGYPFDR